MHFDTRTVSTEPQIMILGALTNFSKFVYVAMHNPHTQSCNLFSTKCSNYFSTTCVTMCTDDAMLI